MLFWSKEAPNVFCLFLLCLVCRTADPDGLFKIKVNKCGVFWFNVIKRMCFCILVQHSFALQVTVIQNDALV